LGSSDEVESRAEGAKGRLLVDGAAGSHAERLAFQLERDLIDAVRNIWDYR
jgi:hypothetical protein